MGAQVSGGHCSITSTGDPRNRARLSSSLCQHSDDPNEAFLVFELFAPALPLLRSDSSWISTFGAANRGYRPHESRFNARRDIDHALQRRRRSADHSYAQCPTLSK